MARLFILLSLLVCIATCVSHISAQKRGTAVRNQRIQWVDYEPAVVELKGRLIVRTYFGPPNFGENPRTDSKERTRILVLDRPINVRGRPDSDARINDTSVRNVREVQLVFPKNAGSLIGKRVVVTGTLFHWFTGHHHKEVLVQVTSLRLVSSR